MVVEMVPPRRILGGLGGAPSISHGLLVVGDGEQSTVEEEIGEDGSTQAGVGLIVVG